MSAPGIKDPTNRCPTCGQRRVLDMERQRAIIVAYREPDATLESVARQFGVTHAVVLYTLQRAGEPRRRPGPRKRKAAP